MGRYAVAALLAAMLVLIHGVLRARLGTYFDPFFVLIVGFSAWQGGLGAGVVTLAIGEVGAFLTAVRLAGGVGLVSRADVLELTPYLISGLLMSLLIAVIMAARHRAERTAARSARLHALNASLGPAVVPDEAVGWVEPQAVTSIKLTPAAMIKWRLVRDTRSLRCDVCCRA